MSLTYAVPDLHGSDDLLDKALAAMALHARQHAVANPTVVFLGDYVDRGPHSRAVLDRLMAGGPPGWRWICLKGNHEQMMADAIKGIDDPEFWNGNGGGATLRGFALDWREIEPYEIPSSYLSWIDHLPLMHVDLHRVFVHAGLDPHRPLDQQIEHDLLWMRRQGPDGHGRLHIVHGHTPDPDGPQLFPGRTNLDTLAWRTGRLVIGVFDDRQAGGPMEILDVLR